LANYRMTTGHKINFPKDDPSAFMTLSGLQFQLNDVTATISNVTGAESMVGQTQTALDGIETQLDLIRTELLTDVRHTLTPAQQAASQAKIDAALEQINALASTSINGKTTLSGAGDYIYSGRNDSQVADVEVRNKVGSSATISGTVNSTATNAEIKYSGDASHQIVADATFTLTGERGSQVISVTTGEALSTVAAQVNQYSHDTGITAAVDELNDKLVFSSVDYGSSASINVAVTSGVFAIDEGGRYEGTNASAVINGQTFSSSSNNVNGNRFTVSDNGMNFEIEFQQGFTGEFDTITVEGDALKFALSTSLGDASTLAIPPVLAADLGGPSGQLDQLFSGGSLSGLGNNTSQAIRVVDEALGMITQVQGNVEGFYNSAIISSSNLLSEMQTQLGDSIDSIDLVNDVEETAISDYYQALADNAVSALTILNQQRLSIVWMLQDIADST
jgi:flagellin-like hook-associated protein FlgL